MIKRYAASLLLVLAVQISSAEEPTLAERYNAARAAYVEAHSQYQAVRSGSSTEEHLRRAGELLLVGEELYQVDHSLLEAAAGYALVELQEHKEELLRRAGELLLVGEELYQIDDPQMLMLEAAYGYALVESQEYKVAQEYLDRALAGLERALGENAEEIVNIIITLANANGGLGEPSEQIRLYERALKIVAERYGEMSYEYVRLESGIAGTALQYSSDPSVERFVASSLSYLPIIRVAPRYPARALSRGLEGYVDVSFTVTAAGHVKDPIVLRSTNRLFEPAATRSVLKYLYRPRIIGGVAVEVPDVKVRISFDLDN
jgi:TonB family protein